MEPKEKIYRAIGYIRISKEEKEKNPGNSIAGQKALLEEYSRTHNDIQLVGFQIDDGFSGVGFCRPGLGKLISQLQNGNADCILVKDLSRFARNYVGAGEYLERIFPAMGIRFIAVTDGYDSEKGNTQQKELLMPVKNLINDFYSGDISQKTKASLQVKRKEGIWVGAFPVYGYKKTKKNCLTEDADAARIVRYIFQKKLEGYSTSAIAHMLNQRGIFCPLEYKKINDVFINENLRRYPMAIWHASAVDVILRNSTYIGRLEQGKTTTVSYKVKKVVKKPPEDWSCVEHCHQPLIPADIFYCVREIMEKDLRHSVYGKEEHCLSGLLYCGDCHMPLHGTSTKKGSVQYQYFVCGSYKKESQSCSSHRVSMKVLFQAVSFSLGWQVLLQWEHWPGKKEKEDYRSKKKNELLKKKILLLKKENSLIRSLEKLESGIETGIIGKKEGELVRKRVDHQREVIQKWLCHTHPLFETDNPLYQDLEQLREKAFSQAVRRAMTVYFIEKVWVYEKTKGYDRIEIQLSFNSLDTVESICNP